ncbi:LPXTG cell wall anchor domain-containing protein [Bacillus sp. SAJ1]|nr:LPXTG cell wall anchor domain-containing protein [Bacillus sp. SAJ1]
MGYPHLLYMITKGGKWMKKRIISLPLVLTVIFIIISPIGKIWAASNTNEIDIATSPHKVLFDVDNLKPGDWATRDLHVQNLGKQDFKYTTSIHFESGSKLFFKALKLKVSDKKGELYSGKLADFNKLDYRKLAKADEETLTFRVDVPTEVGNEYQGLTCKFTIKLYVEGTLGGILPADKSLLSNTGSNVLNAMAGGIILIIGGSSFYLFKRKRAVDIK